MKLGQTIRQISNNTYEEVIPRHDAHGKRNPLFWTEQGVRDS